MAANSKTYRLINILKPVVYLVVLCIICINFNHTTSAISLVDASKKEKQFYLNNMPMPTVKYSKDDFSDAAIKSAEACQNVEYTTLSYLSKGIFSEVKGHDMDVYKKCAALGYCAKNPIQLYEKLGQDATDRAARECLTGGFSQVFYNCSPNYCKDAFNKVSAEDCVKFHNLIYKKEITFNNNFNARNVTQAKQPFLYAVCTSMNFCTKFDTFHKTPADCSNAIKKAKENKKKNKDKDPAQKKRNTVFENQINRLRSKLGTSVSALGDMCSKKVNDVIDDCVKNSGNDNIDKVEQCVNNNFDVKDCNTSMGTDRSDQKKCSDNAGFFGFLWCPGINMLTEVFDTITGMITGGLKWTILIDTRVGSEHVKKDPHHIIYNAWSSVLGVANIVMLIGFIAILYSYALNSNNVAKAYTVKTLISRLIIVAIATNFSFYICAALADLSNIAGVGIYDLIRSMIPGNGDGPFSISGLGIAISTVVGATILIVLAFMSLHLVVLSLIIILALVTLRQIALLMLVIASPLAFACYLFPNTAKWFTKWWNYYIQLLIVFPLFTATWAGSRLVASVLELTHQSNLITTVLSAATPLLAIIPIFKMSGGLMSGMTNKLQGQASKWKGHDDLRRKRVANFAKRNSMALQNKLGSIQPGDHGMGRILSGAAHLAGGGIGLMVGTLAAAANARASDNLDTLSKQAVKDINEEYKEKQKKKAEEKIEEFAKKNHAISDEMASTIEQTIGNNPVKYTENKDGERSNPIITGAIAIKYMAMTGRGIDGKLLDQNTYRAALKYADEHLVMSNDEFNIAVYNVQQNGDKDTRSDFIKRHTNPDKSNHPIFMSKHGQNDFINQSGAFSKDRFEDDDELVNIAAQERTQGTSPEQKQTNTNARGISTEQKQTNTNTQGASPEQKQPQDSTPTRQAQINTQKSTLAGEALDYSRRQYISSLNSAGYNNLSDTARYKLARQTILRKDIASANRIRTLHTRVHRDVNIIKVNDNTKHNMEVIDKALRSFTTRHSGHGPNV